MEFHDQRLGKLIFLLRNGEEAAIVSPLIEIKRIKFDNKVILGRIFNQMVEYKSQQLDIVFRALADATRREILLKISKRPQTVTEIAKSFKISLNGVSKHLKFLEKSGLMVRSRDGRVHYCRMEPRPLKKVDKFIKHYRKLWDKQLDSLEEFLNETKDS